MCGRYDIHSDIKIVETRFGVIYTDEPLAHHYNAAPSQYLPVVRSDTPAHLSRAQWGFLPHWKRPDTALRAMINARAETIEQKPLFRAAFKKNRCLIPADAFYEWKRSGSRKIPYRIGLKTGELCVFAGIWDTYTDTLGITTPTFAILTTNSNSLLATIHHRMPVILRQEDEHDWLNAQLALEDAKQMLIPYPVERMQAYEISTRINAPTYNLPSVIEPIKY
jgi:putative SOS response-associated peptidase YedK